MDKINYYDAQVLGRETEVYIGKEHKGRYLVVITEAGIILRSMPGPSKQAMLLYSDIQNIQLEVYQGKVSFLPTGDTKAIKLVFLKPGVASIVHLLITFRSLRRRGQNKVNCIIKGSLPEELDCLGLIDESINVVGKNDTAKPSESEPSKRKQTAADPDRSSSAKKKKET